LSQNARFSAHLLAAHLAQSDFVVIGHRGAAGLEPENTLASFSRALEFRLPMIELDVRRVRSASASDDLYVIHDDDVRRTTNGKGMVSDFLAEDLVLLDAGGGQTIPTLTDVVDLVTRHHSSTGHRTGVNVELKGTHTADLVAAQIADLVDLPIMVSSFNHDELRRFHELAPLAAAVPLFDKWVDSCFDIAAELEAGSINLSRRLVTEARMAQAKARGVGVFVYTVNKPTQARKLKGIGVDGIFTDRPDRMRDWLP